MLHDSKGIGWRWDDPALGRCDVTITKVVGYKHHGHLQDERFAPGRTVSLKHEPNNPYDSNAVSVWDEQRDVQLGFVPKETAASIAEHFLGGRELDSVVLWEWVNRSDKDSRTGVRLLIAPKDRVTLQRPLS